MLGATNIHAPLQILLPKFLNMDNFTYTGQLRKEMRMAAALSGVNTSEMISDPGYESACFFRLCSVIVHLGQEMNSGHYVTYRRFGGGHRWFVISDEMVDEVEEWRVLRCPAYVAIYEKCPRGSLLTQNNPASAPTSSVASP